MLRIVRKLLLAFLLCTAGTAVISGNAATVVEAASINAAIDSSLNQNHAVALPDSEPLYRITRISTEEGLSSSDIAGVARDGQGFMWFGTVDGLNRYDGYQMKVFKNLRVDPTSLGDNLIRTLYTDRAGTLWVGTWFGGLNRYERETETFTRFQHDPADSTSVSSNSVFAILEDGASNLWLGTRGGGLNRFDSATGVFTHFRHDPGDPASLGNDNVFALAKDADGTLWLGTDGGLDHFDPATASFRHYRHDPDDFTSLSNDLIRSLFVDGDGTLWAGTWGGGLNRFDRKSESFIHYRTEPDNPMSLSNDAVKTIKQAGGGALWIGTYGGGLNLFDPQTGTFRRLGTDKKHPWALDAAIINDLTEDAGMLWLATGSDVYALDLQQKPFVALQHDPNDANSLAANGINSIYEDAQGILWVATASTGLNRIDRAAGTVSHFQENPADPASSSANEIWEIAPSHDGKLWLATFGSGLAEFDTETGRSVYYRNDPNDLTSLASDRVTSVLQDPSGAVWVGTWDAGLDRYDPATGIFSHYLHDPADPTSLSDNAVLVLEEDRNGDLWIGTVAGGVNRFDRRTGRFARYQGDAKNPNSLPVGNVNAVLLDHEGQLWVGTRGGGLTHLNLDTGEVINYTRSNSLLPSDSVFSILEDDQGLLWLSTSNGLSHFDPRAESFRNYDKQDGLPDNVFEASTAFQSASGEMFFGTANGVLAFYPDQIHDKVTVPPVVITDLLLANKPVRIGDSSVLQQAIEETDALELSYQDRIISFEFAALDYIAPQKNRYRYILEGFDEAWTEVGSDHRLVTYTNLDPGDYVFRVVGSNADGIWNEQGASLELTITPPWWETTWFRWSMILLTLGLVTSGFAWQQRSAVIQQQKLEKMVVERTRELRDARTQIGTLFDRSPLGITVATVEGTIVGVNQSMQRMTGYSEDELLQANVRMLYANPEERERLLARLSVDGFLSDYGTQLRRRDGSSFNANLSMSRLNIADQDVVLGITDDITDEVNARDTLTAIYQVSSVLASIPDMQTLLERAFEHLPKSLEIQRAALIRLDDSGESVTLYGYLAATASPELTVHHIPIDSWSFLRTILSVSKPIYIPDIHTGETIPAELDNLPNDEWAAALKASRSWLGLPLLVGERTVGMLNLMHGDADYYDASDIELAGTFANQLAVAVDNIQLHQQAQLAAVADERSRIARDLHDSVTQTLFTASMLAEAAPLIWAKDQDTARQNMEKLSALIRGALAEMRSLLLELRTDPLPEQSLGELLPILVDGMRSRCNANFSIDVQGEIRVPGEVTVTFYRIAQEMLNNVAKHAEASRVNIVLSSKRERLELDIQDDGRGFDQSDIPAGHLGLSIMAERAHKIGAGLQIQSSPGHGTKIHVAWAASEGRNGDG